MTTTLTEQFAAAIEDVIARGVPWEDRIAVLREFRDRGLTAQMATETMTQLCAGKAEEVEDQIHDLMDISTGWCSASRLVWPADQLKC
jgi:hypothetical protein